MKPCPFCGEELKELYSPTCRLTDFGYHYRSCPTIGCVASRIEVTYKNEAAWDRRVQTKNEDPCKYPKRELLRAFATQLLKEWTLQQYWDGEPCERATNPDALVEKFLKRSTP